MCDNDIFHVIYNDSIVNIDHTGYGSPKKKVHIYGLSDGSLNWQNLT